MKVGRSHPSRGSYVTMLRLEALLLATKVCLVCSRFWCNSRLVERGRQKNFAAGAGCGDDEMGGGIGSQGAAKRALVFVMPLRNDS